MTVSTTNALLHDKGNCLPCSSEGLATKSITGYSNKPILDLDPVRFKHASLIIPQLYLSDYSTAENIAKLEELGITHVISLVSTVPLLPASISADQRLHINIVDTTASDILKHLDSTTDFITKAINEDTKNKVLTGNKPQYNCTTVVCAYLVATTDMSVGEAILRTQSSREVAKPNYGFRRQLESYCTRFKPEPSDSADVGSQESDEIMRPQ